MIPGEFASKWSMWFPACPPLRPALRRMFPERWLRVHSLPNAKRFATCDAEREELFRRHASVSRVVLGEGTHCAAILACANGYQGEEEPASVQQLGLTPFAGWPEEWAEDESLADVLEGMTFLVAPCTWSAGKFDDLIRDVAEGATAPLLLVALATGRIYSPYDGGADLFAENAGARNELRVQFSDWISNRADGL